MTISKAKPAQKEKETKERLSQSSSTAERLKTVVRRLPPNLPEDVFWQSVQTWVTEDTITWRMFYQGKFRKRLNKENIPSRAYIAFKDEDQLATFSREYDGHLFRDKAGNESHAVVEFAPYQKIPNDKKKIDARNATIENDEDYISFLQSLDASSGNNEPVSLETLVAAAQPSIQPKTTPLLEALKAEKTAQKEKELASRTQVQPTTGPNVAKKDEGKKKGGPSPKQPEAVQISKKAARKMAAAQKAAAAQASAGAAGPSSQPTVTKPTSPKPSRAQRQQPGPSKTNSELTPVSADPNTATAQPLAGAAPSRKARPVIGVASRPFEAALSGAGVGVGGERKARREREREKETPVDKGAGQGKERGGKGRPSTEGPHRSILQRTILQREAGHEGSDVTVDGAPPLRSGTARRGRGRPLKK